MTQFAANVSKLLMLSNTGDLESISVNIYIFLKKAGPLFFNKTEREARRQPCWIKVTSCCADSLFSPTVTQLPLCQGERSCGTGSGDVIWGDDVTVSGLQHTCTYAQTGEVSLIQSHSAVLTCHSSTSHHSQMLWTVPVPNDRHECWYIHILVYEKSWIYAFGPLDIFVKSWRNIYCFLQPFIHVWSHTMWVTQVVSQVVSRCFESPPLIYIVV